MKSFELVTKNGPLSDHTYNYDVNLLKKLTLKEFIDEIINKKTEWGSIYINDYNVHQKPDDNKIRYENGKILSDTIPEKYLDKEIRMITANGGWSMMNYWVTTD